MQNNNMNQMNNELCQMTNQMNINNRKFLNIKTKTENGIEMVIQSLSLIHI